MVFINDIEMLDIYLDKYLGKIVYKLKCQKDKKWLNYTYENWFKGVNFNFAQENIDLKNVFVYCDNNDELFSMFLDFKILLVHCVNDYYNFGYLNNILVNFIDNNIEIIEENKFELKMSMQSYMISFIGKYRSLWDKIMNILVYIYNNNETFNKYMKKNSKNEFKKIFEKNKIFWDKFSRYRDLIKKFDDNFRTQEIHAVGELYKKLIFSDNKIMGTNYVEINNYFNNLIEFKGVFADLINAVRKIRNY